MNIRKATVFGFVLVMSWLPGCGGDEEEMACVPGTQQECACEGVYQECQEDGSSFTPCECDGSSESARGDESGDETPTEEGGEATTEEGGEVAEEGGEVAEEEGDGVAEEEGDEVAEEEGDEVAEEGGDATEEMMTIAETAASNDDLSSLVTALTETDLLGELSNPEASFTVFAPTNAAFDAEENYLSAHVVSIVRDFLKNHMVEDAVYAETLVTLDKATAVNGFDVTIEVKEDGGIVLNGSVNVTTTDIMCTNGVIHVIDALLLQSEEGEEEEGDAQGEET